MPKKLLEDCVTAAELAKSERKSTATVHNWVNAGMPVIEVFGKRLIHIPTAREWLLSQQKRKNKPQAA